jgi:Predicted periplasmic or secreted lipoprotein
LQKGFRDAEPQPGPCPDKEKAMRQPLLILLLLLTGATVMQGCAALPISEGLTVAQYANTAYSGYRLTDEYFPRSRVDGDPGADMRLEDAVRSRLHEDPRTHYAQVKPLCYGGEIYLLGSVRSEEERRLVTLAASSMPGVKSVTRCLVSPEETLPPARQAALADTVKARLAALGGVRPQRLRVEVVGRHVVVLAYVADEAEQRRLQNALAGLPGPGVTAYLTPLSVDRARLAAR